MESNIKNYINEVIYKIETLTDFKIKFMVTKGKVWGGVIYQKIETNMYSLLYIK